MSKGRSAEIIHLMKKYYQWFFYIVILGVLIWGFITPSGIRGAWANNVWSLAFVEHFYNENSTMQSLPNRTSSHPHAKLLLAREAINSGDDSVALKYITPLIGPDNPMVTNAYAEIAYRQWNYTEAINTWEMAGNLTALHLLTIELREKKLLDAALLAAQSRYSLDRETSTSMLATIYIDRNELSSATELLEISMNEFPHSNSYQTWTRMKSEILLTQANSYSTQGLISEAELAYHASVTVNPNNWVAWKKFGWFNYYTLKDVQSAIACFQGEINANPESGEGHFDLAQLYASERNIESAIYWYEQAFELKPDRKDYLLTYANFLRNSQELSKAVAIYDQLVLAFPDYTDAFYEAALAYAQNQQPDKAIQSIEKALQLMNPPQLKYYLLAGSLYESNGNNNEALKAFENALTIDPNNPEALQAKARLSN